MDPPDFLQTLVDCRYPDGGPIPPVVIVNLIVLLAWAGHETTTGHISWAMIDLLQHPAYLEPVLAEQHAVLGALGSPPAGGPQMEDLRRLHRMEWALYETERLHPVAFIIQRSAFETVEHGGYTIPKGTMIFVAPSVAHRMDAVFTEPDRYMPERFDSDVAGNDRPKRARIGFGGGPHRCLGVHFAYLEMKVVLTLLLRRYRFELVDRHPRPVAGARTKWPQSPCRVLYRLRGGSGTPARGSGAVAAEVP